jgi:hypothetical protein
MPKPKAESSFQFESGRSASVTVELTVRTMKFYNVAEHELDSLSLLNTLQIGFASAGTFLLGLAAPDVLTMLFPVTGAPPADLKKALIFGVLAVAFYVFTWLARDKQKRMWGKIGSETATQPKAVGSQPAAPVS